MNAYNFGNYSSVSFLYATNHSPCACRFGKPAVQEPLRFFQKYWYLTRFSTSYTFVSKATPALCAHGVSMSIPFPSEAPETLGFRKQCSISCPFLLVVLMVLVLLMSDISESCLLAARRGSALLPPGLFTSCLHAGASAISDFQAD